MGLYRQVGGGGWTRDHGSIQTGGGDGQETMGLYKQVGGWTRDHGSVQTGGGGWVRDHGFIQTSRVGGWEGDHRSMQTSHHE